MEDRRGDSGFGGGFSLPIGGGSFGVGTLVVALIGSYFLGVDPMTLLGLLDRAPVAAASQRAGATPTARRRQHGVSFRGCWPRPKTPGKSFLPASGRQYQAPKLVLFSGSTPPPPAAPASRRWGVLRPGDRKVYIDLAFYRDLKTRFQAPGEFAQAYVIAHEVGHHVAESARNFRQGRCPAPARRHRGGQRPVGTPLNCRRTASAGVWGRHDTMKHVLEPGELEQALTAAAAIGDDRLQQQSRGRIVPESFTHGSSAQRALVPEGFETGDIKACNTFAARGAG